jgi:hypothetical protein
MVPIVERIRMKNFVKTMAAALAAGALLAGCASTPPRPDAEPGHPANPAAARSPVPPLNLGLLAPDHTTNALPGANTPSRGHAHE